MTTASVIEQEISRLNRDLTRLKEQLAKLETMFLIRNTEHMIDIITKKINTLKKQQFCDHEETTGFISFGFIDDNTKLFKNYCQSCGALVQTKLVNVNSIKDI